MAYERGRTIRVSVEFTDNNSVYIDPTSPLIKIIKSGGTVMVDDTALTKTETGKYYYLWDTTETEEVTDYFARVKGTYSGHTILDRLKITLTDISE